MNKLVMYGLIVVVIGGVLLFDGSGEGDYAANDIDLNAVLDVTVDTLYSYQEAIDKKIAELPVAEQPSADQVFIGLTEALTANYNAHQPALFDKPIAVAPRQDASMIAFEDANQNQTQEENEEALFLIEIDGENSRIIASSRSGAVNDHHFSGTGLMAGMLIGSMLSRQRSAGVSSSSLANKKPVSAGAAAKARAGSGSHSRGK